MARVGMSVRLRQEYQVVEIPNDGDPRWQELLRNHLTQVVLKYAPLPDCSVEDMECAFIVREMNPNGYTEITYLFDKKYGPRLSAAFTDEVCSRLEKVDAYCLAHPELNALQIVEKLERREIPL
jgi:hypothetical protein